MRAANDYLVLKYVKKEQTKAELQLMTVATEADQQLEIVSVGDHADTSQFTVGSKVIVNVQPDDIFYNEGQMYIAVHSSSVKAVL